MQQNNTLPVSLVYTTDFYTDQNTYDNCDVKLNGHILLETLFSHMKKRNNYLLREIESMK